jgi:hypothetical protein
VAKLVDAPDLTSAERAVDAVVERAERARAAEPAEWV